MPPAKGLVEGLVKGLVPVKEYPGVEPEAVPVVVENSAGKKEGQLVQESEKVPVRVLAQVLEESSVSTKEGPVLEHVQVPEEVLEVILVSTKEGPALEHVQVSVQVAEEVLAERGLVHRTGVLVAGEEGSAHTVAMQAMQAALEELVLALVLVEGGSVHGGVPGEESSVRKGEAQKVAVGGTRGVLRDILRPNCRGSL